jgi:hypothetical protein
MAQFFTDFDSNTVGSFPDEGWTKQHHENEGSADWWSVENSIRTGFSSHSLEFDASAYGGGDTTGLSKDGYSGSDTEILVKVDEAGVYNCRPMLRGSDNAYNRNGYFCFIRGYNGNLEVYEFYNNTAYLRADVATSLDTNKPFFIRFRANGQSISAKAWNTDSSEPGTWTAQFSDGTHTSGWTGFANWLNGSYTCDYVAIGTNGDSAVVPSGVDVGANVGSSTLSVPEPSISGGIKTVGLNVGSLSTSAQSPSVSVPTPSSDVTRGLVSKWKLDGDATDSVGSNNGTATEVAYTSGHIDQAGVFNDTSSAVDIPDDVSMDTASFSVSAWVNLTATSSGTDAIGVVAAKDNGYQDRMFWMVQWDGQWQARVGSNAVTVNGGAAATGTWTHLTLTYDGGTGEINLYVDGSLADTNTETTLDGDGANFTIGAEAVNERVFNGLIDEVRFYNVDLTTSEVSDLYAFDGTTATALSIAANVGSASLVAPGPGVQPGAVSIQSSVASGMASTAPVTLSPGSVGVDATVGQLTASGFEVVVLQDGSAVILADPAVLSASEVSPDTLAGPVSVSTDAAQASASGLPASVQPIPITVVGETATGTLEARATTLTPGPVSATAETATTTTAAPFPTLSVGATSIAATTGTLSVIPLAFRVSGDGTILADPAVMLLTPVDSDLSPGPVLASTEMGSMASSAVSSAVVPGPASVAAGTALSQVAVPDSWSISPGTVSAGLNRADLAVSSVDSTVLPGTASIAALPGSASVGVPAGWDISTQEIQTVLRLLGVVDTRESVLGIVAQDPSLLGTVDLRKSLEVILRK